MALRELAIDASRMSAAEKTGTEWYSLEIIEALAELGVRQPYLFFLSTLQPRKNLIRLIEAFEGLDDVDLTLVLAGRSGWLADPIERRIAESPARARIQRLGHVPDALVPALYNGAAVFVLPSLYEGFGMGVLEAMASGCPVVTSNRSSLPEVAGHAAVLVDPFDVGSIIAGIELALQPEQRAELVQAGLQRAGSCTWERAARQTLAAIRRAYTDAHG
jgi:glycosyltransferase involved in cell wall biosynthesis